MANFATHRGGKELPDFDYRGAFAQIRRLTPAGGWRMVLRKDELKIDDSVLLTASEGVTRMICVRLFTLVLAGTLAATSQTQTKTPPAALADPADGKHSIIVNFNYDFSRTPSCSEKIKKACVVQFNVYDISVGVKSQTKLFSIPAPPGETKPVNGITGKSPRLTLDPGKHELAVTAQMSNGAESKEDATTVWVDIPSNPK